MTPTKGFDLRHYVSPLTEEEKRQAREDGLREKAKAALGDRYVLSLSHAPARGQYNPITGARLA
ncbi:hypothetical protein N6G06_07565 [Cupriavidus gilardii]|uniref:hypothetical protein n=1 Tax=Cupriavidus gilardii TaxID=82541 RepID=UPI0021C0DFF3|nr:hypothetical protein [Cupriavidus gilardii]MCT9071220.1 hypothetical protein [Cupriavidus gilardii]